MLKHAIFDKSCVLFKLGIIYIFYSVLAPATVDAGFIPLDGRSLENVHVCSQRLPIKCLLPPVIAWHFNRNTRRCNTFDYGACPGSSNVFPTEESCLQHCNPEGAFLVQTPSFHYFVKSLCTYLKIFIMLRIAKFKLYKFCINKLFSLFLMQDKQWMHVNKICHLHAEQKPR